MTVEEPGSQHARTVVGPSGPSGPSGPILFTFLIGPLVQRYAHAFGYQPPAEPLAVSGDLSDAEVTPALAKVDDAVSAAQPGHSSRLTVGAAMPAATQLHNLTT